MIVSLRCTVAVLALLLGASPLYAQYNYPFQNPDLPEEERIDDLLARMTLDEKIAALSTDPSVPRLGVEGSGHVEGLHGVAQGGPSNWGRRNPAPTTQFPQAVGLGMTWNPDLVREAAAVEGYEARYLFQSDYDRAALVVRAPNADLARDIRWGRTEESYGEDPYHVGTLTRAFIKGLQGNHPRYWQTASLMKHFLANSNENERTYGTSNFGERLLHEYYAVPFRMGVVDGGSRAYMAAYNAVNGIPMTVHPMMKEMTVNEWGQDGIICTDGGALRLLISDHEHYPDLAWGAAAAVKAGINQFLDDYREPVRQAFDDGLLTEADVDEVLRGVYRVMIRLGQLDPPEMVPYRSIGTGDEREPWETQEHQDLARRVTQESIVLLKNDDATLPMVADALESIAVIGPYADDVLLDWYSGDTLYAVTPLEGIRARAGSRVSVDHASGADTSAAVELARAADVAVLVVGNHPTCHDPGWAECPEPSWGREAVDRRSLQLPDEALIKAVRRAQPTTVVVLTSSFPFAINWTQHEVPAIVHMAQSSQEMGNALADVLFGDYNPGGRLVHTWVTSIDELPPRLDYGLDGRTYLYYDGEPLYPFGHGLSYTTFDYTNLRTSAPTLSADGSITVHVDVTNTGERAGDEVVQLYVRHPETSVTRPRRELKGFDRITLDPGQTQTVAFRMNASDLAFWDVDLDRWTVEEGPVDLLLGASSEDIRLRDTIEVIE